jgi:phage/plasmid-like protein (TIGR03299 family)
VRTNPFTRASEVLGVVGSIYAPIQNEEHCEVLNRLVDESGAIFDTAGSLRGGRQVFVSMRLPQTIMVGGVDAVRTNIAALNSHDGTSAFRLLVTPVRVVCANTQAAALAHHRASFSVRHTTNAKAATAHARSALGITFAYVEAFEAEAEKMIQQTMVDRQFAAMTADLFGVTDADAPVRVRKAARQRVATLAHLWHDAPTQKTIAGTRWAAYQVVTEYVDHYAPVRTKADQATARAQRVLTSDEPNRIKTRAWELCRA